MRAMEMIIGKDRPKVDVHTRSHAHATHMHTWSHAHTMHMRVWNHAHTMHMHMWSHAHTMHTRMRSHAHTMRQVNQTIRVIQRNVGMLPKQKQVTELLAALRGLQVTVMAGIKRVGDDTPGSHCGRRGGSRRC